MAVALDCSLPAIHYALERMGLTYKKRRCAPASKPDIVRARRAWRSQPTRLRPGAVDLPRRVRRENEHDTLALAGSAWPARSRQQSVRPLADYDHDQFDPGGWFHDLLAIEGATDTAVFAAYVRRVLGPTLRAGDVVVMDNLSPHKNELTLAFIRQAGAEVFFLPAYSPDLNPIEKMWSKLKNHLRGAEARTLPDLIQAIATALRQITPQDAINWFACCGYNFI